MNRDVSQEITERIINAIERGGLSWLRGWKTPFPRSLASGKTYRGMNALMLFMTQQEKGYASPSWVTFNETKKRGGSVLKGEKATPIIFYEMRKRTEKNKTGDDEIKTFPFMRCYYVFNIAQTTLNVESDAPEFAPIDAAESVASGYIALSGVTMRGGEPSYNPRTDAVSMPNRALFVSPSAYYATLFHEFAHSTGAKARLNRTLSVKFASPEYAFEELIAELSAAFVCASVGIEGEGIQNNAAYVASWLKTLREDKRAIFRAAKQAQEATDLITGTKRETANAEGAE